MAIDPALEAAYTTAIYEVQFPSGAMRFRVGPSRGGGVAEAFAILTAWNPGSDRPGLEANEAANARLEEELRRRGIRYLPAAGFDDGRTHVEPSFALFGVVGGEVLELAAQFRQAGYFWWDGEAGSIRWV